LFTIHWYPGEAPPLTDVAENVTWVPSQTVSDEASIEALTSKIEYIVIAIELEVAGFPVAHRAFEVITQATTSLFAGA
jgi:hypothetical protein